MPENKPNVPLTTFAADLPGYIPGLSFFYKMSQVDRFAIADDLRFYGKGTLNRARIKAADGLQWLTVPLLRKGKGPQYIKDLRIDNTRQWGQKHWKTLRVNYSYSPYFEYYIDYFEKIYQKEWTFLLDLNMVIVELVRKALGIECPLSFTSLEELREGATEKIVDLALKTDAGCYMADPAHRQFLNEKMFVDNKIELLFSDFQAQTYRQQFGRFAADLSIIDLLFNEGPEAKWILLAQQKSAAGSGED